MANISSDNLETNNNNKIIEIEILDSLKDFIGSGPFGQYLSEYIGNTLRNIDRLGVAIASDDEERVRQYSHKLKGSAGNIGALRLSSECVRLESMSEENQSPDNLRDQFKNLNSVYHETKDALNAYINQLEVSNLNVV